MFFPCVILMLWSLGVTASFVQMPRSNRRTASLSLEGMLLAKPLPSASFDLDTIEAFEFELDTVVDDFVADDEEILHEDPCATTVKRLVITPELNTKRIDAAISLLEPGLSRSQCGNLVMEGLVFLVCDDRKELIDRKSFKVQRGQELEIHFPQEEKTTEILPQNIPLHILYEDEHMIVINKAANMVVHPAAGNRDGTVVNALAYYLRESPYGGGDFVDSVGSQQSAKVLKNVEGTDGDMATFRPGIVHRLDKGTTGVLVVAKTTKILAILSDAFAARKVKKTYLAITVGNPGKRVTIDKPIGRHPIHRQRMRVVPDPHTKDSSGVSPKDRLIQERTPAESGRRALSFVDTLSFDGKLSLVQVSIKTGRTHQIRVHLEHRHTPIYGDEVYGLKDWNKRLSKTHQIERPLLHAYKLELEHPVTGAPMRFTAPLATDMLRVAKAIYPQGESEMPEIFSGSDRFSI
jgi:23S rRNA pseudouridine1911/1915/1917 synthase